MQVASLSRLCVHMYVPNITYTRLLQWPWCFSIIKCLSFCCFLSSCSFLLFHRHIRSVDPDHCAVQKGVSAGTYTRCLSGSLLTAGGRSPLQCLLAWQWPCWPRCAIRPGGNAGTPEHPVGCKTQKQSHISWCYCFQTHLQTFTLQREAMRSAPKRCAAAYLYPTNLGAYLWIWVLNSDGLTGSLLDDVHMVCISLANSTRTENSSYSHTGTSKHLANSTLVLL